MEIEIAGVAAGGGKLTGREGRIHIPKLRVEQ